MRRHLGKDVGGDPFDSAQGRLTPPLQRRREERPTPNVQRRTFNKGKRRGTGMKGSRLESNARLGGGEGRAGESITSHHALKRPARSRRSPAFRDGRSLRSALGVMRCSRWMRLPSITPQTASFNAGSCSRLWLQLRSRRFGPAPAPFRKKEHLPAGCARRPPDRYSCRKSRD
jgi:hypothetical protein